MRANLLTHAGATLIVLIAAAINAPATEAQTNGGAYITAGPALVNGVGNHTSAWQIGGGGELRGTDVGVGGALDYVYFPLERRASRYGHSESPAVGVFTLSLTASYHFFERQMNERKVQPFTMGGVTLILGPEGLPLLALGGGVDWWTTRRAGLRFELRTHFGGPGPPAMLGLRVGLVIR